MKARLSSRLSQDTMDLGSDSSTTNDSSLPENYYGLVRTPPVPLSHFNNGEIQYWHEQYIWAALTKNPTANNSQIVTEILTNFKLLNCLSEEALEIFKIKCSNKVTYCKSVMRKSDGFVEFTCTMSLFDYSSSRNFFPIHQGS